MARIEIGSGVLTRRTWVGAILLLVVSGILPPTVAEAAPVLQLTLSVGGGPATGTVALSGSGFAAGEPVALAVGTAPVGTATARSDGTFPATTVSIPAGTQPGYIPVTAAGRTSHVTAQARYAVKSGWVQAGFDAGRTRWNPYENTLTVDSVKGLVSRWTAPPEVGYSREAIVGDGVLMGASEDGGDIVVSAATGGPIWSSFPGSNLPVVIAGPVSVFTWPDRLGASDPASGGQPQWFRHFPDGSTVGLSSSGGWLYFALAGTGVSRLDPRTGAAAWTAGADTDGSSPVVAGDTVLYAGSEPRTIRALAAGSGQVLWKSALAGAGTISYVGSSPTGIYYRVGQEVVTLAPKTGQETSRWTLPAGTSVKQYAAGHLIAARDSAVAGASSILALNPASGAVQWQTSLPSPAGVTAAGGQVLYLTQREDHPEHFWGFRALDLTTGGLITAVNLPREPLPSLDDHEIKSLEVADGGIYLQTALVSPQGKVDGARIYKFALPYVAPSLVVLDDPGLGYSAGWKIGRNTGDYQGSDHYTETPQSTATYTFTGTGVRYWFSQASHHGVAAVSVDGGAEVRIDQYSATRRDAQTSWTSPRLAPGSHTIRIRATGDKDPAATARVVTVDRLEVGRN